MSDIDRRKGATTTVRPFWPTLKNAFVVVLTNLPSLTRLAAIPVVIEVIIVAATAVLYPHIIRLLSQGIGSELTMMLNVSGLKAMIDLAFFLVTTSMFVVAWLQFLTVGSASDYRTIIRSQEFRRVLFLIPLVFVNPVVRFLTVFYISYFFIFTEATVTKFDLLLPVWAFGLTVGLILEAIVIAWAGPNIIAAALGGRALTPSTWQLRLRNGLGWFLTYRAIGLLFAFVYWPILDGLLISDITRIDFFYGTASIEDWLLVELINLPVIIGTFLGLALGLAFFATVTNIERQETFKVFD